MKSFKPQCQAFFEKTLNATSEEAAQLRAEQQVFLSTLTEEERKAFLADWQEALDSALIRLNVPIRNLSEQSGHLAA